MSDMKCPFCKQELEIGGVDGILRGCPKCRNLGTEILWQELIRTRKALDVAKYAIKNIKDDMKKVKDGDDIWEIQKNLHDYCKTTIKQITALEQKE